MQNHPDDDDYDAVYFERALTTVEQMETKNTNK